MAWGIAFRASTMILPQVPLTWRVHTTGCARFGSEHECGLLLQDTGWIISGIYMKRKRETYIYIYREKERERKRERERKKEREREMEGQREIERVREIERYVYMDASIPEYDHVLVCKGFV